MKKYLVIIFLLFSTNLYSQQFAALGLGLYGDSLNVIGIKSMCKFNGKIVASGYFTKSGNSHLQNIAVWNDSVWRDVGCSTGVLSPATAMCVYKGELYVGGVYDVCEIDPDVGAPDTYIARWDGINWKSAGLEDDDNCQEIYSMIVYKNELVVCGSFTKIGGISAKNIAKWNGLTWTNLGAGLYGGLFGAITMQIFDGDLYVGGDFKYAGGINSRYIAKWDGMKWDSLSTSPNSIVKKLKADTLNNKLYVSGNFTKTGLQTSYGISRWDGNGWLSLAPSDTMNFITDLEIYDNELFVSSYDKTITSNGDTLLFFYKYLINESRWEKIPNTFNNTPTVLITYKGKLAIGGYFNTLYKCIVLYKKIKSGLIIESDKSQVLLYPNPSKNRLNIKSNDIILYIQLFDENGKLLFNKNVNSKNDTISMKDYSSGNYYLEVNFLSQKKSISKIKKVE